MDCLIEDALKTQMVILAGEVFFLRYRYCYIPYCFCFCYSFSITVTSHYVFCYGYLEKKHHSATGHEATCCENSLDALKTQMVILAGEALLWFDA